MLLLIDAVPVEQMFWVLLPSDRAPFDSFMVVTLLGMLKEPLEPVK